MKIVHISDLHLSGLEFIPEWGEKVTDLVNSMSPEFLVVTGDLTDDGYIHEYDIAKRYIDRMEVGNMVLVPGNHDARNEGYKLFEEFFETRFPYYENDKVAIVGVDSTEPDIDDGHVGRENYANMREKLTVEGKVKILAMHHHLIPIPGTGRERHIPVDAGDVLQLCTKLGIDFVFSGHKHVSWIWKLENTYLVTAGTATSRRLKGKSYPSFNALEMTEEGVILRELNVLDGGLKETLRIPIGKDLNIHQKTSYFSSKP